MLEEEIIFKELLEIWLRRVNRKINIVSWIKILMAEIIEKKRIDGFGIAKGAEPFQEEKDEHEEFWNDD